MFGMFRWLFNNNEDDEIQEKSTEVMEVKNVDNYETEENGDIKIRIEKKSDLVYWHTYHDNIIISKSNIISHTENNIVFKSCIYRTNCNLVYYPSIFSDPIENKENFIRYKDTQINIYEYSKEDKCWKHIKTEVVGTEVVAEQTPLEVFKGQFKSKYKLIETEDEFNEYMASALDCDTWCRKKLYDKMKELGLGDGFINQFADLVGNDLDKYHAMIDLANEVTDKDTLMYLYTYKFRQN